MDDLLIRCFLQEICEKSVALILYPASHTKVGPIALYSKIVNATTMSKNPLSMLQLRGYLYKKIYNEISHSKVRYKLG